MEIGKIIAAGLAAALVAGMASAAEFTKPIRIIQGSAGASPTDVTGRLFAERMSARLGQPVVMEVRAGANEIVAINAVLQGEPDGHTILYTTSGVATLHVLRKGFDFDMRKDAIPLSKMVVGPIVWAAHPSVPFNDIDQMVAYMKANPNKVRMGAASAINLLPTSHFMKLTGTQFELIRYAGGPAAYTGVVAGEIEFSSFLTSVAKGFIDGGKMKAIGILTPTRNPQLPNVPAFGESKIPEVRELAAFSGFNSFWMGMFVHPKTPRPVVQALTAALQEAAKDPGTAQKMRPMGMDPLGTTSEEFTAQLSRELDTWRKVAQEAGIKPE